MSAASDTPRNEDPAETARFDAASDWWDPDGPLKTLHDIQPVRLQWIVNGLVASARSSETPLTGLRILDVGCGGGLLTEALARNGAEAVGVDTAREAIQVAKLHALERGVESVTYHAGALEQLPDLMPDATPFDAVVCMELLEHVPDPERLIQDAAKWLRPGGHLMVSTLNRTPSAWLFGIAAAEYVLGILPRGTHRHDRFIRPSELAAWARQCGLALHRLDGLAYNPFARRAALTRDVSINYLAHFRAPTDARETA